MNRIIKFRAWDKKTQTMSKPFEIKQMFDDNFKIFESQETVWLDNIIFIQSTGLYDKNGVEIYDGYIVETTDGYNHKIRFTEGGFNIQDGDHYKLSLYSDIITVIGNIYENPELLK